MPANSTVGQNVTFTIVVTNNGPNTATATMLTDPTPVGLQFVSNSGDCVTAFPCALGDLAVGASRTIQATFLIPVGYSGPSTIMNTATVTRTERYSAWFLKSSPARFSMARAAPRTAI